MSAYHPKAVIVLVRPLSPRLANNGHSLQRFPFEPLMAEIAGAWLFQRGGREQDAELLAPDDR